MISVVGATTWGTTLSILLAQKNLPVTLLLRNKEEGSRLTNIPPCLKPTIFWEEGLRGTSLLILAVPSQRLKENLARLNSYIKHPTLVLSVAKGLDENSGDPPSRIIAQELKEELSNICVLSGPNLAKEIIQGLPAATVVAGERASEIKKLLESPRLKVEVSEDLTGVELSGALKNVIAIGAAMVEGLGYGDNAKAALVTMGFKEMAQLILACGGKMETLISFAGLGDLMLTCYSQQSRNYQFGLAIGRGAPPQEAIKNISGIVEGVATAKGALKLSQRLGVPVPIIEKIYQILFEGREARKAIAEIFDALCGN